jgi:ribosome-binding factor A
MTRRTDRINGLLRQEISELLSRELNDPRLSGVVSITKVETSGDLRYARVFVSVLASRDDKETVLSGISSASKFMRRELGERLSLRYIPELSFILDESLEEADHIFRLMDRLSTEAPLDPRSQMTPKDTPSSG